MLRATFVLAVALLVPGFAQQAELRPPPLRVQGEDVAWDEYAAWLVRNLGVQRLGDFAQETALEQAAREEGIVVEDAAVEARMREEVERRIAHSFEGDAEAWRAELARLDSDEARYYEDRFGETRAALIIDGLARARRVPDEASLRAEWALRHGEGGRSAVLDLLHLTVQPPTPPPDATRDEVRALDRAAREAVRLRAVALRERALEGEPFTELVRSSSEDASTRERNGRLTADEATAWTRTVRDAVASLEAGAISEPLWARGGWNLFRVARVTVVPFEEVRDELARTFAERPTDTRERSAVLASIRLDEDAEALPEMFVPANEGRARLDADVARIGERRVTREEYGAWLMQRHGVDMARPFAEQRVVERRAAELGIVPGADELAERLREDAQRIIDAGFGGDRERWVKDLASRGRTPETWQRDVAPRARHEMLAERLMSRRGPIGEERLRRSWEDRYGPGGRNPRVRLLARTIQPPAEPLTDPEEVAAYITAETACLERELAELRARIVDDGLDFATLARRHSDDPATRERGGEPVGRFVLHTWPEAVQDAIEALEPGGVTAPLVLPGGQVFLFQLQEHVHVPLESVRAELLEELTSARPSRVELRAFVYGLLSDDDVELLPSLRAR